MSQIEDIRQISQEQLTSLVNTFSRQMNIDRAYAEDYIHEAITKILTPGLHCDINEHVRNYRGYILQIAKNLFFDAWRREHKKNCDGESTARFMPLELVFETVDQGPRSSAARFFAEMAASQEQKHRLLKIQRLSQRLPPSLRKVFDLMALGKDADEIATELAMNGKKSAREAISRVRKFFKDEIFMSNQNVSP